MRASKLFDRAKNYLWARGKMNHEKSRFYISCIENFIYFFSVKKQLKNPFTQGEFILKKCNRVTRENTHFFWCSSRSKKSLYQRYIFSVKYPFSISHVLYVFFSGFMPWIEKVPLAKGKIQQKKKKTLEKKSIDTILLIRIKMSVLGTIFKSLVRSR